MKAPSATTLLDGKFEHSKAKGNGGLMRMTWRHLQESTKRTRGLNHPHLIEG